MATDEDSSVKEMFRGRSLSAFVSARCLHLHASPLCLLLNCFPLGCRPAPTAADGVLAPTCCAGASSGGETVSRHSLQGAVGDGKTMNTAAIQRTIDAALAAGGGTAVIPPGTFFERFDFFSRRVLDSLLGGGGGVVGLRCRSRIIRNRSRASRGILEPWRMALVNAQAMNQVRTSGSGKIDGNGAGYWNAFWQARIANPAVTNLAVERPRLMFIDRCQDVHIEGITLQNSGFLESAPLPVPRRAGGRSDHFRTQRPSPSRGLCPPIRAPSSDGIDIDSSQNVTVRGCHISCGDDDIALKGSKGPHADQDADSPPVENILVEDCVIGDGNGIDHLRQRRRRWRGMVMVRNCVMNGDAVDARYQAAARHAAALYGYHDGWHHAGRREVVAC